MNNNLSKVFYKNLFPTAVVKVHEGKKVNLFQKVVCLQLAKYKRYSDVPNVVSFLEWERARYQFAKNWDRLSSVLYVCFGSIVVLAFNFLVIRKAIERAEIKKFGAIQPNVYAFTPEMKALQVANKILREEKALSLREQIAYGWKLMNAGRRGEAELIVAKVALFGPRMPHVESEEPQESQEQKQ